MSTENNTVSVSFSERLSTLISELGISKSEFGRRIGLRPSAITEMIKGRSNPSPQTLKSIKREFSVNEQWLKTGAGEKYSQSGEKVEGRTKVAESGEPFGPEFNDPVTQAAFELFKDLVKKSPIETARKIMVESLEKAEGFTSEQSKGKRVGDESVTKPGKRSKGRVL